MELGEWETEARRDALLESVPGEAPRYAALGLNLCHISGGDMGRWPAREGDMPWSWSALKPTWLVTGQPRKAAGTELENGAGMAFTTPAWSGKLWAAYEGGANGLVGSRPAWLLADDRVKGGGEVGSRGGREDVCRDMVVVGERDAVVVL
jgi:hypothetical protein